MRARVGLGLLAVAIALAVAEGGARLLEPSLRERGLVATSGERVADPVLEYRTVPGTGDHDERGFRNARALARADIVALGDSQTWGVNAPASESWPAQLARDTGRSVYNMGRGGYGMLQYLALLDDALALEPDVLVVALYFGNDIFDAYDLAYKLDAHERWRHPDEAERARIQQADYPDLQRMFFERLNYQEPGFELSTWLRAQSAFARLLETASLLPADTGKDEAWARAHPEDGFVYEAEGASTVFHTSYRLAAVDPSFARIREGLRITEAALVEMGRRVDERPGTSLLVVLLPTKERVFIEAVAVSGTPVPQGYVMGVVEETRLARQLIARMNESGIRYVDAMTALQAAVAAGEAIFPPNVDGHFTPAGYAVIADLVATAIADAP